MNRYPGGIEDCERFRELVHLFEQEEQRNFYYNRAQSVIEQEFGDDWYRSDELVLGGLMLLLYTWNFAAPETKQMDSDRVKELLEAHHAQIEQVRNISLLEADLGKEGIVYNTVAQVYPPFQDYLGQTGTSKVLSLLNPELFVMWDHDIRARKARSRDDPPGEMREDRGIYFYLKDTEHTPHNSTDKFEFGRHFKDYIAYLRYCRDILDDVAGCSFFDEQDTARAKLLDEALYAFYKIEHD